MSKILVIGGTGTTGRTLVKLLKDAGANFQVLVRGKEKAKEMNESGIRTHIGELGNWPSIKPALKNINTVFLLSSPSFEKVSQQNGLIDMAKEEGVRKIVKLSAVIANTGSKIHLADWHGQIEDHLISSGLDYINLRPHSFMQNMLMHLGSIKEQSCFYESMGNAKIPMIDTRDVAQASFDCLMDDRLNNKTYTITGPTSISYHDVAKTLSNVTNREIDYIQVPSVAHNQAMKAAGLPVWLADDLTSMSAMWGKEISVPPTTDFKTISGVKQYELENFAIDYASFFK